MDEGLLVAIIDRIVPADADPGALALGTDRYVLDWLGAHAGDRGLVEAGLARLASARPGLAGLPGAERDAALVAIEAEPWFARLVVLVSEGFYADPDNGGNRDAGSWTMIGYRHGLPEGPSGPPARGRSQ
jgi:hypothetical protein